MRCREGKHHVCPKVGVRWGGWQQLGALWDLIQRRSHSCWPTLSNGLAWISWNLMVRRQIGSPGLTASVLSFICSCFLPKETFRDNQLFRTELSWRKVSWHDKLLCGPKMCVFGHKGPWRRCGNPRPVSEFVAKSPHPCQNFWSWSHQIGAAGLGCSQKSGSSSQNNCIPALAISKKRKKVFQIIWSPSVWIVTSCETRHELSSSLEALKGVGLTSTSQRTGLRFDSSANSSACPHVGNFLSIFKPCTASFCCHSL